MGHLDILPTLLSFAGIAPDGLLNEVGGRNLRDVLEGKASLQRAAAISSLRRSGYWASLRTPHFKYIVNRDADTETELLFDLGNDPGERSPLQRKNEETLSPGARQKFDDLRGGPAETRGEGLLGASDRRRLGTRRLAAPSSGRAAFAGLHPIEGTSC